MSQNSVTLDTPKGPVRICMGWDRPLSEYFCNAMWLDLEDDEDLEEEEAAGPSLPFSFPGGVPEIKESLEAIGLTVPPIVFEKTILDGEANAGNTIRVFAADGSLLREHLT